MVYLTRMEHFNAAHKLYNPSWICARPCGVAHAAACRNNFCAISCSLTLMKLAIVWALNIFGEMLSAAMILLMIRHYKTGLILDARQRVFVVPVQATRLKCG